MRTGWGGGQEVFVGDVKIPGYFPEKAAGPVHRWQMEFFCSTGVPEMWAQTWSLKQRQALLIVVGSIGILFLSFPHSTLLTDENADRQARNPVLLGEERPVLKELLQQQIIKTATAST